MKAYVFRAALYCEACGDAAKRELAPPPGYDAGNESTWDSDDYPKGPYDDGGGEADTPQHCDECGAFLQNPLTPHGVQWLRETLAARAGQESGLIVRETWRDHYAADLAEVGA